MWLALGGNDIKILSLNLFPTLSYTPTLIYTNKNKHGISQKDCQVGYRTSIVTEDETDRLIQGKAQEKKTNGAVSDLILKSSQCLNHCQISLIVSSTILTE